MKPEISRIVLGTDWMVAVPNHPDWNLLPTRRADAVLNRAVELGVNAFDTARMYWSEGVVGRFVKQHPLGRDAFWIISKGGAPSRLIPLSREKLFRQLDRSLRALGTDYIDVHLLHYDDLTVPARTIANWSIELVRSGKVRHVGYSNVSLHRLKAFRGYLAEAEVAPWVSNEFNVFTEGDGERWKGAQNISRDWEYLDYLRQNRLPFLAYSPLGRGAIKNRSELQKNERQVEETERMQRLGSLAASHGVPLSAVALNYILTASPVFHPIIGTSKVEHLKQNMQALAFQMTADDWNKLGSQRQGRG